MSQDNIDDTLNNKPIARKSQKNEGKTFFDLLKGEAKASKDLAKHIKSLEEILLSPESIYAMDQKEMVNLYKILQDSKSKKDNIILKAYQILVSNEMMKQYLNSANVIEQRQDIEQSKVVRHIISRVQEKAKLLENREDG